MTTPLSPALRHLALATFLLGSVAPATRAETVAQQPAVAPETAAPADSPEALAHDAAFFTDTACRRLKPGVTEAQLAGFRSPLLKRVAAALLAGKYDTAYRAADYEAFASPRQLGDELKLGLGFSAYENITGMYLDAGEHVVLVGDTGGKKVALLIPEMMRRPTPGHAPTKDPRGWGLYKQTIELKPGINLVSVKLAGNAYLSYFDDHAESAPRIAVHFPTGRVNGYFDASRMNNADWDRLLDNAVSPIMDARGRHIQVAYPVEYFKTFARGKGVELIGSYDTILGHHYTMLGLVKYNKVPKNLILSRVNFNYYMFRDGDGVAYLGDKGTMGMVVNPERVVKGDPCWGFSHEAGHVLQMRQLTWGGMGEVSNNLFSLYTCTKLGNASRLKEGKHYAAARKAILDASPGKSYLADPDPFNRLVPFWQLHLYFARHGQPDFYADVFEQLRNRPSAGNGNDSIKNQFEFIKLACDVGKVDLTEFFEKWGFFVPGHLSLNDYGQYEFDITPEMIAATKAAIAAKNLPKPALDITTLED